MNTNIKNTKSYAIGVDIGGTKMRAVLWNGEKVIADYELATPGDNLGHFLVMIKALLEPLFDRAKADKVAVAGVGLGIAGEVDMSTGKLHGTPNLPLLEGQPVIKKIEAELGFGLVVDNDAKSFTRGEALAGAGRGHKSVFGLTIGTGIGGAWWNGEGIHAGAHGIAGEVGHSVIEASSSLDFEKTYQRLAQNNPGKLSQEAILGDVLAERAFREFGRNLGVLLANIAYIVDPEVFVLGGGVMQSADLFLNQARATLKERLIFPAAAKKIKIVKSKLGENAGAIGAALLVA